MKNKMKEHN